MSSSQELYNQLNEKLRELMSVKNSKQITNWIWIVVGILQSELCHLSQIANDLPMKSEAASRITLLRRWLMNPHIKVWSFYHYLRQLGSRNWLKSGMNHAQTSDLLENLGQ